MNVYQVTAVAEQDHAQQHDVFGLTLKPMRVETRVPMPHGTERDRREQLIHIARGMVRSMRQHATKAIYEAIFRGALNEGFDYELYERDTLETTLQENKKLTEQHSEDHRRLSAYRAFFEAEGKNWKAIERGALA